MNLARTLEIRRYLRLTPFETETATGRTAERYRRATLSAAADGVAKVCGMGLIFLGVSLTLPYLGPERFGVWATVTSLTAMLSLLDLGMGNALINRIAVATAHSDKAAVARVASGGLATLTILGFLVGSALVLLASIVPWDIVVKLRDPANAAETRHAAMLFGVLFGFNIVATGVRSIFIGLQRAYIAHAMMALGYVAAMAALWFGAEARAGVPTLLLLTFGVQLLAAAALAGLAGSRGLLAWPSIADIHSEFSGLVRVGGLFLVLQIGLMTSFGGDSLMIAHVRGAEDVAHFSVVLRLFQLVALPLAIISAPLWGAYAEARTRQDTDFIRKALRTNVAIVFVLGLGGVLTIATAAQLIIAWWTNGAVMVPQDLINVFAFWTLVQGIGGTIGVFLNGMAIIKPQILAVTALVMIGLPLKWVLLDSYGLTAFVAGSVLAYLVTHLGVYGTLYVRHALQRPQVTDERRSSPANYATGPAK